MKGSFNTIAPIPKSTPQNVTIGGKRKIAIFKIRRKKTSKLIDKKVTIVNVILSATQK